MHESGQMTARAKIRAMIQEWRKQSWALVLVQGCTKLGVSGSCGNFEQFIWLNALKSANVNLPINCQTSHHHQQPQLMCIFGPVPMPDSVFSIPESLLSFRPMQSSARFLRPSFDGALIPPNVTVAAIPSVDSSVGSSAQKQGLGIGTWFVFQNLFFVLILSRIFLCLNFLF